MHGFFGVINEVNGSDDNKASDAPEQGRDYVNLGRALSRFLARGSKLAKAYLVLSLLLM